MTSPKKPIRFLILDVDGTLTDGGIYLSDKGDEFKKFNAKDGMGIKKLLKNNIHVGLISASVSVNTVERRAEMLGIPYCYVGNADKLGILSNWLEELKLSLDEVAFIGDDINDLSVIKEVGFSACPSDAVSEIRTIVDVVLEKKGGEGCVREFIEKYM